MGEWKLGRHRLLCENHSVKAAQIMLREQLTYLTSPRPQYCCGAFGALDLPPSIVALFRKQKGER